MANAPISRFRPVHLPGYQPWSWAVVVVFWHHCTLALLIRGGTVAEGQEKVVWINRGILPIHRYKSE